MIAAFERFLDALFAPLARELARMPASAFRHLLAGLRGPRLVPKFDFEAGGRKRPPVFVCTFLVIPRSRSDPWDPSGPALSCNSAWVPRTSLRLTVG